MGLSLYFEDGVCLLYYDSHLSICSLRMYEIVFAPMGVILSFSEFEAFQFLVEAMKNGNTTKVLFFNLFEVVRENEGDFDLQDEEGTPLGGQVCEDLFLKSWSRDHFPLSPESYKYPDSCLSEEEGLLKRHLQEYVWNLECE
ncbi:hypothetical protein A2U01_0019300, partial [Trifolium medium]|nr:hypothetical protein [Trifolium medium]